MFFLSFVKVLLPYLSLCLCLTAFHYCSLNNPFLSIVLACQADTFHLFCCLSLYFTQVNMITEFYWLISSFPTSPKKKSQGYASNTHCSSATQIYKQFCYSSQLVILFNSWQNILYNFSRCNATLK